jgi:hypothetical protein
MESGTMKAMIVEKHMTKNGIHCSRKDIAKTQKTPHQQICNLPRKKYALIHLQALEIALY